MKIFIATAAAFLSLQAQAAQGIVYHCTINDYNEAGVISTKFDFEPNEKLQATSSEQSRAQLYLDGTTLHISLRPNVDREQYSAVTGFDLPKRINVIYSVKTPARLAAMLHCEL